jgi:hypothetical protein
MNPSFSSIAVRAKTLRVRTFLAQYVDSILVFVLVSAIILFLTDIPFA